ncbi:uncharacterized protein C8R40DRAFT_1069132 [Lentinula edodes]|uniref:uncharacterized protein n=1 Tax=Lentinula edodes TaxID=5353 RepID=UPI001E8ECDE8|nr:uncharacterized protein C8R40DRAFT_1069132 [Lentinula edodes]KAH7875950.1 hypothetical protein C8R40DRAFT_1069132 [Lentinula edodes]
MEQLGADILSLVAEFGEGRKTLVHLGNTSRTLHTTLQPLLYVSVDCNMLYALAADSWIGQHTHAPHPCAMVEEVVFVLPTISPASVVLLRRAMVNLAKYNNDKAIRSLTLVSPDLSIGDILPSTIPNSLMNIGQISLSCASGSVDRRLSGRLMAELTSKFLTSFSLDLQAVKRPDYATVAKLLQHTAYVARNLHCLLLKLDQKFVEHPHQRLQKLLDSDDFVFIELNLFFFSDCRGVFEPSNFVARHRTLHSFIYVARMYRGLICGPDVPDLQHFEGGVCAVSHLLSYPASQLSSVVIRGQRPSAIQWHDLINSTSLSRSVVTLRLLTRGGFLFRHIETLATAAPGLQHLSFSLSHQCVLLYNLPNLKTLVIMTSGDATEIRDAVQVGLSSLPIPSPLQSIRVYSPFTTDAGSLAVFSWGKAILSVGMCAKVLTSFPTIMSTNLATFPNEILAGVTSYLADDKAALCSFSLSCKHFAAVATPTLYRTVHTLGLPTLASNALLLSQIMGQSPVSFVREITVSADDEEEICPLSVPGTVSLHNAPMSNELNLLSHTTESITLDWTQADNPPSYSVITNLIAVLPSRLQNLKSLELNIPPVVSDEDVREIQMVFDSETINFPFLTCFVFGEIYGDISLTAFFRRHPAITTLGYCGISNEGQLVDLIRAGSVLTNVHSFIGTSDSAVVVATALSTKLTVLTLTGPTAVLLFRDVACQVLQTCYWLRELRLPSPIGYDSHELQTISDYVPGLAVLNSSQPVAPNHAFNFYSTILLCFTSLTKVEVTLCTPYSKRLRLQHRDSFLRALRTYRNPSTRCLSVVIRTSSPSKTLFALDVVDSSPWPAPSSQAQRYRFYSYAGSLSSITHLFISAVCARCTPPSNGRPLPIAHNRIQRVGVPVPFEAVPVNGGRGTLGHLLQRRPLRTVHNAGISGQHAVTPFSIKTAALCVHIMDRSALALLRSNLHGRDTYLGSDLNVAPGHGAWVEDDGMHRWTGPAVNGCASPVTLEIVAKVYTYGNYTGILGGRRKENKSFKLRSIRRTLCLTAPKDITWLTFKLEEGPLSICGKRVLRNLQVPFYVLAAMCLRYDFNLQAGQPKDSRIMDVAPADEKDDVQWLEVANDCFLTRLDVRDHTGRLIPEVDVQSALTGATVLASFNLKSWRWNKAKPTGFAADLVNIVILSRSDALAPTTLPVAWQPISPLPAPTWMIPTERRDYSVGSTASTGGDGLALPVTLPLLNRKVIEHVPRRRLDGLPEYPLAAEYYDRGGQMHVAGRQPMVYNTPNADQKNARDEHSTVECATGSMMMERTGSTDGSTATACGVPPPVAVKDIEQSSAADATDKLPVQPKTPTSFGANTDVGAVSSVQQVDTYPVTQPGSEVVGERSKAVGKVTSFTFEEEGQPLKEPVNTNGKRRASTQNAKAGPSKVARTAGQVKD